MPNHITNLISFGDQPEQVAAFHQMLRDLRQKDGVYGSIDFNKLIPMPKALCKCHIFKSDLICIRILGDRWFWLLFRS